MLKDVTDTICGVYMCVWVWAWCQVYIEAQSLISRLQKTEASELHQSQLFQKCTPWIPQFMRLHECVRVGERSHRVQYERAWKWRKLLFLPIFSFVLLVSTPKPLASKTSFAPRSINTQRRSPPSLIFKWHTYRQVCLQNDEYEQTYSVITFWTWHLFKSLKLCVIAETYLTNQVILQHCCSCYSWFTQCMCEFSLFMW